MNNFEEYHGKEASEKVKLFKQIDKDLEKWEIYYLDENTGQKWIMDYPNSNQHGGGSPRLKKM